MSNSNSVIPDNKDFKAAGNHRSGQARGRLRAALGSGLLFLCGGVLAHADSLSFSYGSLANGASDSQIQTYMRNQMGALGSVTVTGAVASNSYTGDDHVVGPCTASHNGHCRADTPITLAHSDGTFIMNDNGVGSSEIKMAFTGLAAGTYSFSFDLEIFPDGSCANGNGGCGSNWPDLELAVNSTTIQTWLGLMPGTGGTYADSKAMLSGETAPQLLGNSSTKGTMGPGGIVSPSFTVGGDGKATLEFVDWPATIAIDNLFITPPSRTSPVPETSSVLLLGTVSGLLIPLFRRLRKV